MRRGVRTGTYRTTIEDLGRSRTALDVTVRYTLWPGEPRVPYYPDGSGYPEADPEVEISDVSVDVACGADTHVRRYQIDRGWLEWLDEIAYREVVTRSDEVEAEILKKIAEER